MKSYYTKHKAPSNKYPKRLMSILNGMKKRCYNTKNISYQYYGAKGIGICKEWLECNSNFYEWAINNGYKDNLSIDRIDSSKDYSPLNCRWATPLQQSRNLSNNHYITYNNETHCMSEWAEILNVSRDVVKQKWKSKTFYKLFQA